jgi:hypothetical protein
MSTRAEKIACRSSWRDRFSASFPKMNFFNRHWPMHSSRGLDPLKGVFLDREDHRLTGTFGDHSPTSARWEPTIRTSRDQPTPARYSGRTTHRPCDKRSRVIFSRPRPWHNQKLIQGFSTQGLPRPDHSKNAAAYYRKKVNSAKFASCTLLAVILGG